MKGLVGGPLLVGGPGPGLPAPLPPPLKSGPASSAMIPMLVRKQRHPKINWSTSLAPADPLLYQHGLGV